MKRTTEYRSDISIGRPIRNLPHDHIDRLDEAYFEMDSGLSMKMRNRAHFNYTRPPLVSLVRDEEMLAVQQNIGYEIDDRAQEALWTELYRDLPLSYLTMKVVDTWPGNVLIRGVNERHLFLGTHPEFVPERQLVLAALQKHISRLFGTPQAGVEAAWQPDYLPGYHLATMEPVNSAWVTREVTRAAQAAYVIPDQLILNGVQMVTALRQL